MDRRDFIKLISVASASLVGSPFLKISLERDTSGRNLFIANSIRGINSEFFGEIDVKELVEAMAGSTYDKLIRKANSNLCHMSVMNSPIYTIPPSLTTEGCTLTAKSRMSRFGMNSEDLRQLSIVAGQEKMINIISEDLSNELAIESEGKKFFGLHSLYLFPTCNAQTFEPELRVKFRFDAI